MKTDILQSITERLREVLPSGAHAILFGSRARGDARHDSDWDVLILLDKTKIEAADYDNVSYPLVELGWSLNECISPVLYTFKDWVNHHFTPFLPQCERQRDTVGMSLSKEDIKAVVACDWASEVVIPILGNYMGRLVVKLESLIDF